MRNTRRRLTIVALAVLAVLALGTLDAGAGTPSTTQVHLTRSSLHPGQNVQIYGRVTPASPGHTVLLQRRLQGRWTTVKRQRTGAYSKYRFTRTLHTLGTYVFRVVETKGPRYNRSVSATVRVRVVPRQSSGGGASCTPGYNPCIPPGPDVDCAGGSGDGPRYIQGPVYVTGSDPYGLDSDGDGIGCES